MPTHMTHLQQLLVSYTTILIDKKPTEQKQYTDYYKRTGNSEVP